MMYNEYDWSKHLDEEAKTAKRAYTCTKKITTAKQWNYSADGSASCASSSYERIYEAYYESKSYEW